ncbi:hypothetical protein ACGFR6_06255 [Streptomyces sp. NPDC048567]|uniref:hypothetical protein n=1 Tax=Streptomyces sp. NPDC048567 TaxID=3365570 RepID=UPI0037206AC4
MTAPRHRKRLGWEDAPMGSQQAPLTTDAEGSLIFSGPCPRCMGAFSKTYRTTTPGLAKGVGSQGRPAKPITVLCECGVNHAGRPDVEKQLGCGAHWQVDRP